MSMAQEVYKQSTVPNIVPMKIAGQSINFKVRRKTDYVRKDGTAQIYLDCFVNKERVRIPVDDLTATEKEWNADVGKFRGRSQKAQDANLIIQEYAKRVHEISVKVRLGDVTITKDSFVDHVRNFTISTDFLKFYIWKINERSRGELASGTVRHHKTCYNSFRKFCKGELPFYEINDDLIFRYQQYLRTIGLTESTIDSRIKNLRTYFNCALQQGFKFQFPKRALKGRHFVSNREALSFEQVRMAQTLYHGNIVDDQVRKLLQYFLFACFTGLRYGDIKRLGREHIIGNRIVIVPEKTKKKGRIISIPIPAPAWQYLNRGDGPLFNHVYCNQTTNRYLKTVARLINAKIKLTFHCSRHTFATQFLEHDGKIHVLQNLLGHSAIKETMIYAHVTNKVKEEQMDVFGSAFYK